MECQAHCFTRITYIGMQVWPIIRLISEIMYERTLYNILPDNANEEVAEKCYWNYRYLNPGPSDFKISARLLMHSPFHSHFQLYLGCFKPLTMV